METQEDSEENLCDSEGYPIGKNLSKLRNDPRNDTFVCKVDVRMPWNENNADLNCDVFLRCMIDKPTRIDLCFEMMHMECFSRSIKVYANFIAEPNYWLMHRSAMGSIPIFCGVFSMRSRSHYDGIRKTKPGSML